MLISLMLLKIAVSAEVAQGIHQVLDRFKETIVDLPDVPDWDQLVEGDNICEAVDGGTTVASVEFQSKSQTGAANQQGYALLMRGNNSWIPWAPNGPGGDGSYLTIYTSKRNLTRQEFQMGMRLVADTHARWLKTTPQAPIKMYTIVYGTDDKGNPVSGLLPASAMVDAWSQASSCPSLAIRYSHSH